MLLLSKSSFPCVREPRLVAGAIESTLPACLEQIYPAFVTIGVRSGIQMSTTRAASKMEELMVALLDKMDQRNERLLEKMEQRNEQLRLLTQQQSDRVDDIGQRQKETDQEVSAIAGELSPVKMAKDGRLFAMEGSAAGLTGQLRTEEVASRELLKCEPREDLLQEPGFRSTAHLFLPSAGTRLDAVGEGMDLAGDAITVVGATSNQLRSGSLEKKLPLDAYRTQFELLADVNRLDNAGKATCQAISLRSAAATVLTNLPPKKRQDYGALTAALDSRFGVAHQTELNWMQSKARTHRREESLAELVEDFKLVGGRPTEGKRLCVHQYRKEPGTLRYFRVPSPIHIDQGQNLESALRTLEALLAKLVDYSQKDWDRHIQLLLLAAIHETTGCFPAKLMFDDRDTTLPIDLAFDRPAEAPLTAVGCADILQEQLERVVDITKNHLRIMTDRMKQKYGSSPGCHQLHPGDAAWLHNPQRKQGLTPKLQRPWQGPYTIIKWINDLVYRIKLGPTTKPKVVHRNRLWAYTGANAPTWFEATEQAAKLPSCPTGTLASGATDHPVPNESQLQRSNRLRRPPNQY